MKIAYNPIEPIVKKAVLALAGTGLALSICRLGLHTFLCDTYVENIWMKYRYGHPAKKLHSNLLPLTADVLIDLDLISKSHKFEFFPCNGQEPTYLGLYHLRKAYIGLPFYFEYLNENNVDKNELVFFNEQAPNWKREEGKQFLKNLVLSENAKMYAIAENVALSKTFENYMRCTAPFVASLFSAFSGARMVVYLKDKYPKMSRVRCHTISFLVGVFMLVVWSCMIKLAIDESTRETIDQFLEQIKDKQDYIDGGIEYYIKFQKRNLLFRGFMGDDGKRYIRSNGDILKYLSHRYTISQMIEKLSECDKHFVKSASSQSK